MLHMWDILSRYTVYNNKYELLIFFLLLRTVVWSNDVGEQAQSACFSPDGEVIVVGTITGKWVVLSAATREVFSVNQVSLNTLEICVGYHIFSFNALYQHVNPCSCIS